MQKMTSCIICGSTFLRPLYDPGPQPVAGLDIHLPLSREEALDAPRLPMAYCQCPVCTHVFNPEFNIKNVKYESGASIIYNNSKLWKEYMQETASYLASSDPKTVVEIGCGDGVFMGYLKQCNPSMDVIGFDPGAVDTPDVILDYFFPARDIPIYKPDLIVCRHVLEHIHNPREFLFEIWHACNINKHQPTLYFEMPCFEKGFEQGRIFDFIYEHVSNYTRTSLRTLFTLSNFAIIEDDTWYNDEIVSILAYPRLHGDAPLFDTHVHTLRKDLQEVQCPVVWGGGGKCASFLNMFDCTFIDHVVDSDPRKHGRYVPGTGQLIQSPETIKEHETIIIPNVWRALDIYKEIQARQLSYKQILIPYRGQLHDYRSISTKL